MIHVLAVRPAPVFSELADEEINEGYLEEAKARICCSKKESNMMTGRFHTYSKPPLAFEHQPTHSP